MEPRLRRWRVMREGVVESVTLATVLSASMVNAVARRETASPSPMRAPPSYPRAFSAARSELASVSTLPTRNERYSSLRVGARNA